jgi:hypothetical protein
LHKIRVLASIVIEKVYLQNHAKLTQNWNSESFKNPLNPFQNPFSKISSKFFKIEFFIYLFYYRGRKRKTIIL